VNAGRAALGAPNVQFPGREVDIVPAQGNQLRSPQTVPIGYQEGRGVAMAPAVFRRSLNQLLDFALGEYSRGRGGRRTVTLTDLSAVVAPTSNRGHPGIHMGPCRARETWPLAPWSAADGSNVFHGFSRFWRPTVTVLIRSVTVLI